ncbi:hypothetical protein ACFWPX_12575 [Nocardia sp. NPDC058518]|uniref:hypothetical protein n=1 Tax=Nocardia sp. NPDC058518 TaxID=3346534 RepID=UPI00365B7CFC
MQPDGDETEFDRKWNKVRSDAHDFSKQLTVALEKERLAPGQLIDEYVFAKQNLARAMKSAICSLTTAEHRETFDALHQRIAAEVRRRYAHAIPEKYLRVKYRSDVHVDLFATLIRHQGVEVEADILRLVTADSVHAERRLRELRELGFDITWKTTKSISKYKLNSLDLDFQMCASLVANKIKGDKGLVVSKRREYLAILGVND